MEGKKGVKPLKRAFLADFSDLCRKNGRFWMDIAPWGA
jgi:hypothetical protein